MSTQWIITDAIRDEWRRSGHKFPASASALEVNGMGASERLLAMRKARGAGTENIVIVDGGRLENDRPWAYVSDVVSKSGVNPLRGLGAIMTVPFIDVSHLYHLPDGKNGLTVTALGSRYEADNKVVPACGELHDLAILAHTEGLRVTAIVVEDGRLNDLDPAEIISS